MSENQDTERRVQELLDQLTLKEKVSLLSGRDSWCTVPIERLGIPVLTMTDGPHGVRANRTGPERVQGAATSFPTGVSMAASWNPALIERVGAALGQETRALGCDILLGPCVNIMRTPLAGRNFESYAEDPYLAGRIGVAWVKGLQSRGVGASLKHYACNNQEIERMRGNSLVDERTMREIYLPAFEAVVKEARPWTVMCSYNRINGVYASQHRHLLTEILKEEWGFEGLVVSDWGANHTIFASVQGGLDLEMPGPAKYYGRLLVEAVHNWQIDEAAVDESVRRILRTIVRSNKMDDPAGIPQGAVNTPEHQTLARELAQESIVLLQNRGDVLPLDPAGIRSIAVIGPTAAEARSGGGGSSYLEPPYRVSPLDGLKARLGDAVAIAYEQGCDNYVELPALKADYLTPAQGEGNGLWGEYYSTDDLSGKPQAGRVDRDLNTWHLWPPEGVSTEAFSVCWTGTLVVPTAGRHTFQAISTASTRLYLDGELLFETTPAEQRGPWLFGQGTAHAELQAGRAYTLRFEFCKPAEVERGALQLLFAYDPLPEQDDRIARAVELARRSDVALIVGGMPRGFESEGYDRPHMELPGRQEELIRAVAQANEHTVVVLNCGSPVEMPWLDDVPAVVLAFYPGQEGGNALAAILFGDVNPSGKLPVTFPRRYEDNPSFINYPGTKEVLYGEGLFVGYRYYDTKDVEPLFPFGFGLSYTAFAYGELQAPATIRAGEPFEVALTVTNTGGRPGQEVVQLYIHDGESSLVRPLQELKGFAKVHLEPGESRIVRMRLDARALSFYDPYRKGWIAEPGEFTIRVGASSRDIRAQATVVLAG
jgi:beta-glucosidase